MIKKIKYVKYLFPIICLFSLQTFSQTDCEKAKLSLKKAETDHEKAKAAEKPHREKIREAGWAFQNAYMTWVKVVETWAKADKNDLKAQKNLDKTRKALNKAMKAWKKSRLASFEIEKISPLEGFYKEILRIKEKIKTICKTNSSEINKIQ